MITDIIGKKSPSTRKTILYNGVEHYSNFDIPNAFNNHFARIGHVLNSNLEVNLDPVRAVPYNIETIAPVSSSECSNIIKNLKLAGNDRDELPIKLLKECREIIAPSICGLSTYPM